MLDQALIETRHLGLLDYRESLALQRELHAKVVAGEDKAYLLVVEHPPVLTLGKHADPRFLNFGEAYFKSRGVDVVPVERGGEVTAHEPGQIVVYPILALEAFRLAPKSYVCLLEGAVIDVLAEFGIEAWRDPEHPGVWTRGGKICAVGIRIKERATLHGIALNVVNDLGLFAQIVPCGIQGRSVTTMQREGAAVADTAAVAAALERKIRAALIERRKGMPVAACTTDGTAVSSAPSTD